MSSPRQGFLLALAGLCAGRVASAQEGSLAPLVFRLASGTRAMAMGNAFVAGRGPEMVFYNPAQMLLGGGRGSALSVQRIGSGSTLGSLATVGSLGAVAIGAGIEFLEYDAPHSGSPFTPPSQLTLGGPIESSSLAAGVAAGLRWKGVRLGAALRYAEEHVGAGRAGGLSVDFGAGREIGRISVGLAVQHLGAGLSFPGAAADLPTRVTAGAVLPGVSVGSYVDLLVTTAVSVERDGRILPGGGAELSYEPVSGWTFVIRAGGHRRDEQPSASSWAPSFGAGFGLDRFSLDYGLEPARGPGSIHRIGIRLQ